MKRNSILIGGLGVVAVTASLLLTNSFETDTRAQYSKNRQSLDQEQDASDYLEWWKTKMLDLETGEEISKEKLNQIVTAYRELSRNKNITVEWKEHGPDNIGGRTRAILIQHDDNNIIWAGGVTGGLYRTLNGADTWSRVQNFPGNQYISSIEQDAGGNIYVATGSEDERLAWSGNGLFVTPDEGDTWQLVPGTDSYGKISRVAATENNSLIYFTTGTELLKYTYGGTVESVSTYPGQGAETLAYSRDGKVLVVCDITNSTHVSTDWGQTWISPSGGGAGEISQSFGRIEYAISSKKSNGEYSIYASMVTGTPNNSNNKGQWISLNSGQTWTEHTPSTGPDLDNGVINYRNQGTWNCVASFDPDDPKRVIVGGIDLHEWKQQIDNPPSGSWNKISLWNVAPTNDFYVHADNHELKWSDDGVLYIGNDGGIGISLDKGQTFYPANRGYNVTQFYHVAYDKHGSVVGGTQDNGSLYNDHSNHTYKEFKQISGGDGFSAEISFSNPDVIFTTSQFGTIYRSADGGDNMGSFTPVLPPTYEPIGSSVDYPFNTSISMMQYYDENSEDTISFTPQANYDVGDTVKIPSLSTGDTIDYVTPEALFYDDTLYYNPTLTEMEYEVVDEISGLTYDLGIYPFTYLPTASGSYPPLVGDSLSVNVPNGPDTIIVESVSGYENYYGTNAGANDTLNMRKDTARLGVAWSEVRLADPYQSWFIFSTNKNGGEIWGTRDALRFAQNNPKWVRIAENLQGSEFDAAWSEDMNHLYITCGGSIFRIDSLGSVYSSDPDFEEKVDIDEGTASTLVTSKTLVQSGSFEGIGINRNNADDLVACQAFNGDVYRTSNGTSASPSMSVVGSQNGMAYYDLVIDRNDEDVLFAATFMGTAISEDGGATWTDVSDDEFLGTPGFEIRQSWRTWEEGNRRPGEIYVGTHGRGIWSTDAVLNVEGQDPVSQLKEESGISLEVYPNPSRYNSTLIVDLTENNNLEIQFFNISGRLVKRIEKTNAHIGRNEVVFSAEDLPQGTYLIRVKSGTQMQTTKFMKM